MQMLEQHWRMMKCTRRLKEYADKQFQPFCTRHRLTVAHLRILMTLYFEGPMSSGRLAEGSCMAGANSSVLCKTLAARGYILRQRTEGDERRLQISLAGPGEDLIKQFLAEHKQYYDTLRKRVPAKDLDDVLLRMEQLIAAIDAQEENTAV